MAQSKTIINRVLISSRYSIDLARLTQSEIETLIAELTEELEYRNENPDGALNPDATLQSYMKREEYDGTK